jgi:Asp-tRNA(Asn)/Glu-tRNA(Gln) amidotransferase A subunit family amidase
MIFMHQGFDNKAARHASASMVLLLLVYPFPSEGQSQTRAFHLTEATIQDVQDAYKSGRLTAHELVQLYLNRIEAYDKKGPSLNTIITINPRALQEADQLDAAFKASGLTGPLHGIPVIIKDQIDTKGIVVLGNSI